MGLPSTSPSWSGKNAGRRAWRYRLPHGHLHRRALQQSHRTRPVGDDAFSFVDEYRVFGRLHHRYARYTAVSPVSDQYRFTGEYFVRWT